MSTMDKEKILDAYHWRHACKEFDSSYKISEADFNFLLEVARLSPSSFGLQPYEIFVLKNKELLEKLHPHMWGAQKQLFTASHVIMFVVRKDITMADHYCDHIMIDVQKTTGDMLAARRTIIQQYQFGELKSQEDPAHLVEWAVRQSYIALGNLMTAAAMIAIDSCPIEGFIKEKVTEILVENNVIDPNKYSVGVFCCLGKRLSAPAREKTRKPETEFVHYFL